LDTGSCTGSHPVLGSLERPVVRVAGRTLTPAPATLVGDTFPVHAPRLRTRAAVVRLFAGRPLATVHLVRRGQILVEGSTDTSRRTWTLSVPPGISRLVLDTGDPATASTRPHCRGHPAGSVSRRPARRSAIPALRAIFGAARAIAMGDRPLSGWRRAPAPPASSSTAASARAARPRSPQCGQW